jgi:hypothetical protein
MPPPPDARTISDDISDVEAFVAEVRGFLGMAA